MSRTGKAARFFAAGFDTVAMGALAYDATGGRVAANATEWVLWGAVLAAALCTLVIVVDSAAALAWTAIGLDAFGPDVDTDTADPPYDGSHQLTTGAAPPAAAGPDATHNSVAIDGATALVLPCSPQPPPRQEVK